MIFFRHYFCTGMFQSEFEDSDDNEGGTQNVNNNNSHCSTSPSTEKTSWKPSTAENRKNWRNKRKLLLDIIYPESIC